MEKELLDAINRLSSTIDSLGSSLGISRSRTAGKTGGVNRGTSDPMQEMSKKMGAHQQRLAAIMSRQIEADVKAGKKLTKSQLEAQAAINANSKSVKENTKERQALSEAERKAKYELEELARANKSAVKSTGEFAKNLLVGGADLKSSLGSLGSSLGYAASKGNKLAGMFATIAGGTAFALSTMEAFAKNAAAVADSVDLSAVNAGFITSRQLFSSLGQSFNKVLNESNNSFKIFGSTTEDAIHNLSRLSNGLRTGSVSTAITNRLGKDSAKQFKEAAKATANLGLTQDEQASLQASIMQQVRLTAKNEVDAQRMLVKQYSETVVSARNLSNSFGIGAKEILKAIENFNKSASGKTTQRLGVKGATDALAMLKSMNLGLSEEQMQKMAVDIARGRAGDAATMVADDPNAYNAVIALGDSFKEAQANGGVTDKTLREAMLRRRDQVMGGAIGAGQNGTGLGVTTGGKMAESYENLNDFYTRLNEGGRKAEADRAGKEKDGKTTEADNIKTMNVLTAALDSLKGAVSSLISAVYANTGVMGLLIASIAGAALLTAISKGVLKGLTGGAGSIFGKLVEKIGIGRTVGAVGTAGASGLGTTLTMLGSKFMEWGGALFGTLKNVFQNGLLSYFPRFTAMLSSAGGVIGNAFTLLKTSIVESLLPALGRFGSSMLSFATSIPGILKNFGSTLMSLMKSLGSSLGGLGGSLGKLLKGAAVVAAGGFVIDSAMGAMGVGKDKDGNKIVIDEAQDDANWNKATTWEKIQSALPRGIEKLGSMFFMDNMANEARQQRIKNETEYLKKQGRFADANAAAMPAAMTTPTTDTVTANNNLQTGLQGATATGPGLTTGGMTGPKDPLAAADLATKQILSYLSAITVDIAAIRGNTRPDNSATAPVRLG